MSYEWRASHSRGAERARVPNGILLLMVLVAAYLAAQIIADITAVKLVIIAGIAMPGGTLMYALTFTLTDFIQRKTTKAVADALVVIAAVVNIVMALYFQLIINIPRAPFWPQGSQDAFAQTLGILWMIVGPSILAEVVAGLIDNWVYELVRSKPWLGMLLSNLVSVPIDSVLFAGLAFGLLPLLFGGNAYTVADLWALVRGQVFFKWVVSATIAPLMFFMRQGRAAIAAATSGD